MRAGILSLTLAVLSGVILLSANRTAEAVPYCIYHKKCMKFRWPSEECDRCLECVRSGGTFIQTKLKGKARWICMRKVPDDRIRFLQKGGNFKPMEMIEKDRK